MALGVSRRGCEPLLDDMPTLRRSHDDTETLGGHDVVLCLEA
jgi:hypothetical protein